MHSYYALTYMCVSSCMCRAQATPVSNACPNSGRLLLNHTDHVCRGFAVLRHELLLWMPE